MLIMTPFKCNHCNFSTKHKYSFTRHLQTVHNDKYFQPRGQQPLFQEKHTEHSQSLKVDQSPKSRQPFQYHGVHHSQSQEVYQTTEPQQQYHEMYNTEDLKHQESSYQKQIQNLKNVLHNQQAKHDEELNRMKKKYQQKYARALKKALLDMQAKHEYELKSLHKKKKKNK